MLRHAEQIASAAEQVEKLNREGYMLLNEPVFSPSNYVDVDTAKNVFHLEIDPVQQREELAVRCILEAGQCSLHDARLMHGSDPNTSDIRRCGYTVRFMRTNVKLNPEVNRKRMH